MTSFTENISTILDLVKKTNPKRILDVGSGFGKFGLLIREMHLSDMAEETKNLLPQSEITIDCVEEAPFFQNLPYHKELYDNHWHCDFFKIPLEKINSYDLLLLIDVVEHWEKEKAKEFLSKINAKMIISTPKKVLMFKEKYYLARNHVSQWGKEDFKGEDFSSKKSYIFLERSKVCNPNEIVLLFKNEKGTHPKK
jgi:2-polyprenyl-3-methyl-5-hydroxy-6-metoxy-1,4-benzoquinol methylase